MWPLTAKGLWKTLEVVTHIMHFKPKTWLFPTCNYFKFVCQSSQNSCTEHAFHVLRCNLMRSQIFKLFHYFHWTLANIGIFIKLVHLQQLKILNFKNFSESNSCNLLGIHFVFATHSNTSQREKSFCLKKFKF